MRILMTGGGTGGHVNPAIAIADYFKSRDPSTDVAFVGTSRGIENKLVPAAGYKLFHVDISGFKRKLSVDNLRTLKLMITSQWQSGRIIDEFKPDLVIGTGGYVCWPLVNVAAKRGIPTAVHESNAIPGVAVKLLQKKVDKIYVNFEATLSHLKFPEKAVRVGNPLRGDFGRISKEEARRKLGIEGKYRQLILSCGGSLGAERVNLEVLKLMRDFTAENPHIKHVHATGSIEYEESCRIFHEYGLDKFSNIELVEYIYDMPLKMAAADLVINRAGAITLSELATQGKPCILIPSPNVTDNHQYKNAKVLADAGAAIVFEEKDFDETTLADAVSSVITDRVQLAKMSENILKFSVSNCAEVLYDDLCTLISEKKCQKK